MAAQRLPQLRRRALRARRAVAATLARGARRIVDGRFARRGRPHRASRARHRGRPRYAGAAGRGRVARAQRCRTAASSPIDGAAHVPFLSHPDAFGQRARPLPFGKRDSARVCQSRRAAWKMCRDRGSSGRARSRRDRSARSAPAFRACRADLRRGGGAAAGSRGRGWRNASMSCGSRRRAILDAGCGTGEALPELAARYPQARRSRWTRAADARSRRASASARAARSPTVCCRRLACAHPAPHRSFAATWRAAVRVAPVRPRLEQSHAAMGRRAAARACRISPRARIGGLVTFTTFGPDTLKELRRGVRRRRRPSARDPLPRHARRRRHARASRIRRSGHAHGNAHADLRRRALADARSQGDRRDQRGAGPADAASRDARRFAARARGARRDAGPRSGRPDCGDVRGDLRPRVESGAAAHGGRACHRARSSDERRSSFPAPTPASARRAFAVALLRALVAGGVACSRDEARGGRHCAGRARQRRCRRAARPPAMSMRLRRT